MKRNVVLFVLILITGYSVQYAISQKKIADEQIQAKVEAALQLVDCNKTIIEFNVSAQKTSEQIALMEQELKKCREKK